MAQKLDACSSIRWAFNVGAWKPSKEQWLKASSVIQQEELERICRFVFARDSKAAIVGRLLMRKMAIETLAMRPDCVQFGRTEHGKPFLITGESDNRVPPSFSFNVSHQGSYCVLAAESECPVGIDITRTIYEGGKPVNEFFRLMRRQFTPQEWVVIRRPTKEKDRLRLFYRHWALKESYVKALGVGIGFDLQRVGFQVKSDLNCNSIVTDTTLTVDGSPATNWKFEEIQLDDEHCIAVALGVRDDSSSNVQHSSERLFEIISFDNLVSNLVSVRPFDESIWNQFKVKLESPSSSQ